MTELKVSSYVIVRERCPMRFRVTGDDDVEFSFGGTRDPFEFVFDAVALREFLRLGADALRKMDEYEHSAVGG
jgi:hypothetical protein